MSDQLPDYTASNPAKVVPKKGVGNGGPGWMLDGDGNWIPTQERTRKILDAFEKGGCHYALMSDIVFQHIMDRIGVPEMVTRLKDAMDAKSFKVVKVRDAEGNETAETFEFPDHANRLRAVDILLDQLTSEKRMAALHLHRHEGPRAADASGDMERIRNSPAAKRAMLRQMGMPEDKIEDALRSMEAPEVVDVPVEEGEEEPA